MRADQKKRDGLEKKYSGRTGGKHLPTAGGGTPKSHKIRAKERGQKKKEEGKTPEILILSRGNLGKTKNSRGK